VRAGKLKALAMTGRQRSAAAPDVPTVAESGIAGYYASLWYALLAPAATPREITARLYRETSKILHSPAMRDLMVSQGAEPVGNTPEELATFLQSEIGRWSKVIRDAGIRAD
jgi:tripartite-type tricarboxylate transporter receptor subunit TctC